MGGPVVQTGPLVFSKGHHTNREIRMGTPTAWEDPSGSRCDEDHDQDRGATLVEYVLMVSLIALVCVVALGYFQDEVRTSFSESASAVAEAGG